MRYGIFGDVHGNLEAFQEVLKAYKKQNIDRYICVGDIVGYGADPGKSIEEIKRLGAKTVCGNHDWASVGLFDPGYFNHAARKALKWTEQNLIPQDKGFLKSLKLVMDEDNFSVVHGSLDEPESFHYITDVESSLTCFQRMEKQICFVGHSHVSEVFFMEDGEIMHTFEDRVSIKPGVKYIVNVGSVGQPRDGNPKAMFSILDTDRDTLEMKRVDYDIETAKNKILDAGLPVILGYRLVEGR